MPASNKTFRGRFIFPFFISLTFASSVIGAELSIEYTTIARSGVTPIPESAGTFSNFTSAPAIDSEGNVVLVGSGNGQTGVYTVINGYIQKVADLNTPVPGGSGQTFGGFNWDDIDIDGGRVAFKSAGSGVTGLYSNVGQSHPGNLVEVALFDGTEWTNDKRPWVDGDVVAMKGQRLIPEVHEAILLWNGTDLTESLVDPGNGNRVGYNMQASISGDAAILIRGDTGDWELAISYGGGVFDTLADFGVTPMPGLNGISFSGVYNYPVVDQDGLDAAFLGYGSQIGGVYKRVNVGALSRVTDTTMPIPGTVADQFSTFSESGLALANGKVVFVGKGQGLLDGLYTDVGGELAVIVDDRTNNVIELDGSTEELVAFGMSSKSFAYTPNGYELVFKGYFATGGSALIRARFIEGSPGPSIDFFTVFKEFSDNNSASVSVSLSCTSGTVSNNPQWASEASPAIFAVEGALPGASCTAVENSVPSGYTANQSDCQDGDPVDGSCTIVNLSLIHI